MGRVLTEIDPLGSTTSYGYDSRGNLTSRTDANWLTSLIYKTSTNATIDTFSYALDNVANRLTKTDSEYQYSYSYDNTYRVTQSLPAQVASPTFQQYTEAFTYDDVGNRHRPGVSKASQL